MTVRQLDLSALEAYRADLYHCADCNYCVDAVWSERGLNGVCGTIRHHSPALSYSGRGFINAARALLEGHALNPEVLAERVFTCAGCGSCEAACPINLRPAQIGQTLRLQLAEAGHLPPPLAEFVTRWRRQHNVLGVEMEHSPPWCAGLEPEPAATATLHYAPGCAAAHARPDEARAVLQLLRNAGERVHFASRPACCGAPLVETGSITREESSAALVREAAGLPVVGSGLECLAGWQTAMGETQVLSVAQWLQRALDQGRVRCRPRDELPMAVQVFDSCVSRRVTGAQRDEPDLRTLLRHLGQAVANPGPGSRHTLCCGASGGLPVLQPAAAQRMAGDRLRQADGLPVVATDLRCLSHLTSVDPTARLFGLAGYLARYFEVGVPA